MRVLRLGQPNLAGLLVPGQPAAIKLGKPAETCGLFIEQTMVTVLVGLLSVPPRQLFLMTQLFILSATLTPLSLLLLTLHR